MPKQITAIIVDDEQDAIDGDNKLHIENSSITEPLIYGEFDNDLV